jgi:UDP-glucose 4-epimerase
MSILVTGSSGHLGEALVRTLRDRKQAVVGLDIKASPLTDIVGSVSDPHIVREAMQGVTAVVHAATLHKPHVATHSKSAFVDTNVGGTLALLEGAVEQGVGCFIFTSTTSAFGHSLRPLEGAPAVWVNESLKPSPRNIYGVTKIAAEDVCELIHRQSGLPCLVLRTSRFFPEEDDDKRIRDGYEDANAKVNEFLYRRVELQDVVDAHLLAIEKAASIGFSRYIISATTPFRLADTEMLSNRAPEVVARYFPEYVDEYAKRGWKMFPRIQRVYDNALAREALGWRPRYDFATLLQMLRAGEDHQSEIAQIVGRKGYHEAEFESGPYPVQPG